MVIAEQVQNGMNRQIADLAPRRVPEFLRLLLRPLERDRHIPQRHESRFRVFILVPILGQDAGGKLEHRERQNVRRLVNIPVGLVDRADGRIVRHENVNFTRRIHALFVQRREDALADLTLEKQRVRRFCLAGHDNVMLHVLSLF